MFNILNGLATLLAVEILAIPQIGLADVAKVLGWVFLVFFPNYSLGQGMTEIFSNYVNIGVCVDDQVQSICKLGIAGPCCKGENSTFI